MTLDWILYCPRFCLLLTIQRYFVRPLCPKESRRPHCLPLRWFLRYYLVSWCSVCFQERLAAFLWCAYYVVWEKKVFGVRFVEEKFKEHRKSSPTVVGSLRKKKMKQICHLRSLAPQQKNVKMAAVFRSFQRPAPNFWRMAVGGSLPVTASINHNQTVLDTSTSWRTVTTNRYECQTCTEWQRGTTMTHCPPSATTIQMHDENVAPADLLLNQPAVHLAVPY